MFELTGGLTLGFVIGIFVGIGMHKSSVEDRCISGWHWKDVDYAYSCTVTKRP